MPWAYANTCLYMFSVKYSVITIYESNKTRYSIHTLRKNYRRMGDNPLIDKVITVVCYIELLIYLFATSRCSFSRKYILFLHLCARASDFPLIFNVFLSERGDNLSMHYLVKALTARVQTLEL